MTCYTILRYTKGVLPLNLPPVRADHADQAAHVESGDAAVLLDILCPNICLAIWKRTASAALLQELRRLDLSGVRDFRLRGPLHRIDAILKAELGQAGFPDMPAFRATILEAAEQMATVSGAAALALRVEVVDDNACRLFHADYVTLRALMTFIGPGTQWVRASAGKDPAPADINNIAPFAMALLKGRLLTEEPTVLHRSPPIAGTGQRRLLLVIDAVEDQAPIQTADEQQNRLAAEAAT